MMLAHSSLARSTVVVGGGLAGLSAAIEAAQLGAAVTVLEKEARAGGNSAKASSGMNAAPSLVQTQLGIADSVDAFVADTLTAGKHKADPQLVSILAQQSVDAWKFLERYGIVLDEVSQCGGHSVPRTHREKELDGKPKAVGWDIMRALQMHVSTLSPNETMDSTATSPNFEPNTIKVITGAKATKLLGEKGKRVTGVQFDYATTGTCHQMIADSVILATGGYAADSAGPSSLIQTYTPQHARLATTNGPWATGDGVKLGMEFGALAADLDQVQIHPTGFVDPKDPGANVKILAPESLRAYGALLIDLKTSSRFVNELTTRDAVSQAILGLLPENKDKTSPTTTPSTVLMIMNQHVVSSYGEAAIGFYQKRGLVARFETLAALANQYGLDPKTLQAEVCINEEETVSKDRFGKSTIPTLFKPDEVIYAALITPVRHYTMGGLRITSEAQAMTEAHEPIANLFCCGEVSCGVDGWNRLAGNSLLSSVVFGRIAGMASMK
ncbi:putative NADH-dependent fumarate reductase [Obelidium mucronatum]|nr:putative NADH-dependent fumarate reductase [Obelidium mucronatum]